MCPKFKYESTDIDVPTKQRELQLVRPDDICILMCICTGACLHMQTRIVTVMSEQYCTCVPIHTWLLWWVRGSWSRMLRMLRSTRDSCMLPLMQVSVFCILDQLPKQQTDQLQQLARKFDSVAAYMQLFGLTGSRQCGVLPVEPVHVYLVQLK